MAATTLTVGCGRTVEGTAMKEGTSDVPRNDDSMKKYPNLLKECDVLTEDILATQQGVADRFFKLGLIPKQVVVRDAVWKPVQT